MEKGLLSELSHGNSPVAAAYVQRMDGDPSPGTLLPRKPSPRIVLPVPKALLAAFLDEDV